MQRPLIALSASVLLLGLAGCSAGSDAAAPSGASSGAPAAAAGGTDNLRDLRYCEIIPVTRDKATINSEVYNTLGFNDCPADIWATITEELVNEEYGSIQSKLNGPRHWMMDEIIAGGSSVDSPTFTFGGDNGILMQRRGLIQTKVGQDTVGDQYYVPNQVARDTAFIYKAGQPVFELTDPDGHVYMMQSYSQIVDPNLTYDQLADLGTRLALPAGWSYSTRTLDEEFRLTTESTDGIAFVINDDLLNSYMRSR